MEFETITTWHWLVLAIALLIIEALGASGFLLGVSAAAFALAAITALDLITSWQNQLLCFAPLAVIFTVIYWRFFRAFNTESDTPLLNDRAAQLIGRKLILEETLENGQGKVKVGDTFWRAEAEAELASGTRIEVYGSDGMTLKVRPLEQ